MAPITSKDVEAQLAEDAYGTTKPAKGVEDEHDDSHADQAGLSWRTPGAGIVRDIKRTLLTNYFKEITSINQKVIAVTFFLFFACITPAIAFGGLYEKLTNKWIGVTEMIAATAWCGILYALTSGMPVFINGGTGPVLAFTGVLYTVSETLDVPFLAFNAWVGIWVGIYLFIAAIFNLNRHLEIVSRFTDEVFAALISAIFIISAATGLYNYFKEDHKSHQIMIDKLNWEKHGIDRLNGTQSHVMDPDYTQTMRPVGGVDYSHLSVALLSLITGVMTMVVAVTFRGMRNSPYFNKTVRDFLADFGVVLAIVSMVVFDMFIVPDVRTERLSAPNDFSPTFACCDATCRTLYPDECNATTIASILGPDGTGLPIRRPWLVDLGDLNGKDWVPMFAAVPAMLAFILVFLDDGITWHLVNKKDNKLTHGTAYHWDSIIIAVCIVVNSLLGLPWLVAATVRSINHVQSLATKERVTDPVTGHVTEFIASVNQQRLSNLFIHILVLAAIFAMPVIKSIPMPVLYGVFLYMGLVSLWTNQFWNRLCMMIMQADLFPPTLYTAGRTKVDKWQIHKFTLIQLVLFIVLYVVKSLKTVAIAFPIIIALCVPIRMYALPKIFTQAELGALDNPSAERPKDDEQDGKGK